MKITKLISATFHRLPLSVQLFLVRCLIGVVWFLVRVVPAKKRGPLTAEETNRLVDETIIRNRFRELAKTAGSVEFVSGP